MPSVQQAIARLNRVMDNLENSVSHVERELAGKQRDMFAAPASPPVVANGNTLDAGLVAEKLDQAIERIESALKEERG
ncbi:MAG: hypothetical protein IT559_01680 [Alphaproteobacteria bacterium]|nr:hypothetical protein [Alphaproteobacteria bacterium]